MSTTIGTQAGGSGQATSRRVIWAVNSGNWWAFAYTGTNVLSAWYSPDNTTWTAATGHTLTNAHLSEGRNLAVGYSNIGGADVVEVAIVFKSGTNIGVHAIRATIAATTITWHTTETSLNAGSSDADSLFWAGPTVEIDASAKWHVGAGWASSSAGYNGAMAEQTSAADAGTAEQLTPLTWTAHDIDNSVATETRSGYLVDLGAGTMGYIVDNGSAVSTTTGLEWATWSGSGAWSQGSGLGNVDVTGSITAIDRNDWGAVRLSSTDVHVVYRDASGNLQHRRWNGTSWGAGQAIPAGPSPATGTGVALCTDGLSVWLSVIDTDTAHTVRTIRWTDGYRNGTGTDAWDATWSATETSTQTRTWIGAARDVVAQTGLVYWTQGSSLVAATFSAVTPDPLWVQTAQGSSSASQSTFAVAFTTANVTAGNRIIVGLCIFGNSGAVISSVTDSAGNTYAKDSPACVLSDGSDVSIWSAPITAGGGTKPTVTAHASLASFKWAMWVSEYVVNAAASAFLDGTAVDNASAVTSPATSGASAPAPGATGELAFGLFGDTNSQTSITPSSGWTLRGTAILSSSTAEGCIADQTTVAGTGSNASFAIPSTGQAAGILVVVYRLPAATGSYPESPHPRLTRSRPIWMRRERAFMSGQRLAYPAVAAASALALVGDPTSSAAVASLNSPVTLAVALSGAITGTASLAATPAQSAALGGSISSLSAASAAAAVAALLAGPVQAIGALPATAAVAAALAGPAAAISGVQATAGAAAAISGRSAAITTASGTAGLATALAGPLASVSVAAATAGVSAALSGSLAGASSAASAPTAAAALAGPIVIVGSVAGNLQAVTGTQISGPIRSIATLAGTLSASLAVTGPVIATSGLSATAALAAALAGSLRAVSQATATASLQAALAGPTAATSALTATSAVAATLSGPVTSRGQLAGAAALAAALSGPVGSTSGLAATLALVASLAGQVTATTTLAGVLSGQSSNPVNPPVTVTLSGKRATAIGSQGRGHTVAGGQTEASGSAGRDGVVGSQGRDKATTT